VRIFWGAGETSGAIYIIHILFDFLILIDKVQRGGSMEGMSAELRSEIRGAVVPIIQRIEKANEDIKILTIALEATQARCPHEGVRVYRDRKVGACPLCRKRFMTYAEVDAIFVD
jgi:hypothetical protein